MVKDIHCPFRVAFSVKTTQKNYGQEEKILERTVEGIYCHEKKWLHTVSMDRSLDENI